MKPKDLKHPFSWEERRVHLQEGVLFVPAYIDNYDDFIFPKWQEIFGNDNPVHIEYCSGNGSWITQRAIDHPEINWVAIEKRFDRVRKIWSKGQNEGLKNLFVICGEGHTTTKHYFESESAVQVYVNFPDPWPKDRHAKHRIITPEFVGQVHRVLKPSGKLMLVTDDVDYSERMVAAVSANGLLTADYPAPHFVTDLDGYGDSFFYSLWRGLDRAIRYHQFTKEKPLGS